MGIINELTNTGERPILNRRIEEIDPVLQVAYKFATNSINNNDRVLDYGCGGGYGAEYLSRFTEEEVVGYDIDKNTICKAKDFFKNSGNLKFIDILDETDKFDVIVSFQVIEHLTEKNRTDYMKKISNLLNKDGVFFLSTVNKNISSYELKKPVMPFHIKEYYPKELQNILEGYFSSVSCYGQIETGVLGKVRDGKFDYEQVKSGGFKNRVLRKSSQYELVRKVARFTPLAIKSFIFNYQPSSESYEITQEPWEIDNSYILIYKCKK